MLMQRKGESRLKYKFEIDESKWNYVEDIGLPEDGQWCFLIWRTHKGDYTYHLGGYNDRENSFYVNFGMGGCVLEADSVIAWVDLFEDQDALLKVID